MITESGWEKEEPKVKRITEVVIITVDAHKYKVSFANTMKVSSSISMLLTVYDLSKCVDVVTDYRSMVHQIIHTCSICNVGHNQAHALRLQDVAAVDSAQVGRAMARIAVLPSYEDARQQYRSHL